MEISSANMWFCEQEIIEDPDFIQLHQMMDQHDYELGVLDYQTLTMENYLLDQSLSSINNEHKPNMWNNCMTESKPLIKPAAPSNSSSQIISFQNSNSTSESLGQVYGGVSNVMKRKRGRDDETLNVVALISEGSHDQGGKCFKEHRKVDKERKVGDTTRGPLHAQDHVMAERKRREKLSQRFTALSAILPSLKKMDKASVLEDAINYVRKLEEQVKTLEKETAVQTVECAVFLRKSHVVADSASCVENSGSYQLQRHDHSLPDIEARVSDKDVLVKINCKNQRGCLAKILEEIEKLHLSIRKTSVLPFGNSILDITIVAQMDADYSLTTKDLVRNPRKAIVHYLINGVVGFCCSQLCNPAQHAFLYSTLFARLTS